MNIRTRILLIVAVMSFVIVLVGGMAAFVAAGYSVKMDELENAAARAYNGERLNRLVTAVVMDSRGIYASDTVEAATPFAEGILRTLDTMDGHIAAWAPLVPAADKAAFDAMVERSAEFRTFRTETARLGTVDPAAANAQGNNEDNRANRRAYQAEIDAIVETDQAAYTRIKQEVAAFQSFVLPFVIAVSLTGVLGGTAFAIFVASRHVTGPLSRLTGVMQRLAHGELDVEVPHAAQSDEIGQMASAVEVFRENGIRVARLTEDERQGHNRAAARAAMMERFQTDFDDVVAATLSGDLERRAAAGYEDADIERIATNFNGFIDTLARGLGETASVLAALAETDLTRRMQGEYQGAFAQLRADTNRVAENLGEIIGKLKRTSFDLKTATGEILAGANDLSERTTRQAATIEETSAAMEQLATTVMQNARRAGDASENAGTVMRAAEDGGQVMHRATEAMERITTSSSKISNIIGLIDDIAFQTNLLALNASVEAARAGEAGKGFAVVAVEVRRLAQSAAEASSEVKTLIEQSGAEVGAGSKLVAEAATRLEAMLSGARRNSELLEGIARESHEQASAIDEVNVAIRQLDEMTQHNAALVEETNAAIEQTEAQATELDHIVDVFTTSERPSEAKPAGRSRKALTNQGPTATAGRIARAAKAYLTQGNAALDREWEEF